MPLLNKLTEIRGVIALILILSYVFMVAYIIVTYGKDREVLMFITGVITTTTGGVIGYYFGATHKKSEEDINHEQKS